MTVTTYDELEELMDELQIVVRAGGAEYRTEHHGQAWEHYAYRFSLEVRGEQLMSNAPYVSGVGNERPPRLAEIFGALIADIQSVEPYAVTDEEEHNSVFAQERAQWPPNWDQWADDLGLVTDAASARKAADDFREIMARRWLVRDRLGADDFARLLDVEL